MRYIAFFPDKTIECTGLEHRVVEAGQTVVYRCTVYYFGSWTPTVQWTEQSGVAVNSRTHTNRTSLLKGSVTTVLMVTATPTLDGTRLLCHVRWQARHNLPPFYATNSPSFNMTVITKGMTVLCKHELLILESMSAKHQVTNRVHYLVIVN